MSKELSSQKQVLRSFSSCASDMKKSREIAQCSVELLHVDLQTSDSLKLVDKNKSRPYILLAQAHLIRALSVLAISSSSESH